MNIVKILVFNHKYSVKIKIENPLKAEAKKSAGLKDEAAAMEEINDTKQALKKVRSCDVLKSDDLGN